VNATIVNNRYHNAANGFISANANETREWFDVVANNTQF
jgi:hypothetical protein